MKIDISPVSAWPNTGTQVLVDDGKYRLGQDANFQVTLLDSAGTPVATPQRNTLTPEQFNAWGETYGNDDQFAAQCVAYNLGFLPPEGTTWPCIPATV